MRRVWPPGTFDRLSRAGAVMEAPRFDNSFARLPDQFFTRIDPVPVSDPQLIALNVSLVGQMGLDEDWLLSEAGLAMMAGNAMPSNAAPLAQVYAGHQFGGWSPQLGDGRAHLLGEVVGPDGLNWDIQLKGSGQTPYSRMGDGRAWLGPVLREYIISEAMHALGVPTTRALAAVSTGEPVLREQGYLPGAILTRVAPSHLRVGHFQYFAAEQDSDALGILLKYAIQKHYPDLDDDDAPGFLRAVMLAQADLVGRWMALGFIHGVMNTDNTHIGAITIDYGPCAFMDAYHPGKVFSSIDQFGRYAYGAQPQILVWNLAQLATALLPLMGSDRDKAISEAEAILEGYGAAYTDAWMRHMLPKIGITEPHEGDVELLQDLLNRMAENQADFTRTFRGLANGSTRDEFVDPTAFDAWASTWRGRVPDAPDLNRVNPAFIARNHRIEEAIQAALQADFAPFERLVEVLRHPYDDQPAHNDLQNAPLDQELVTQTFCGT